MSEYAIWETSFVDFQVEYTTKHGKDLLKYPKDDRQFILKNRYLDQIYTAYKAGLFTKDTPEVHNDVKVALEKAIKAEVEAKIQNALQDAYKWNSIKSKDDLAGLDCVYAIKDGFYFAIVKVYDWHVDLYKGKAGIESYPFRAVWKLSSVDLRRKYIDKVEPDVKAYEF